MKKDYLELSVEEFSEKYPRESVLYRAQIKNWATDLTVKNGVWNGDLTIKNSWIYGIPGVIKIRWVRSQCSDDMIFPKGICKWWNGYNPQVH
ncbi:hypothetical protein M9Y10_009308 [Tritrichomonas musculus]|uniref:Uncharacterized protein n=1 Tax=Tritrichomonas musculus TaxID=1915356 RepID=A0ABR2IN79_9EUKA